MVAAVVVVQVRRHPDSPVLARDVLTMPVVHQDRRMELVVVAAHRLGALAVWAVLLAYLAALVLPARQMRMAPAAAVREEAQLPGLASVAPAVRDTCLSSGLHRGI